ncbi:MAG: AFG1 family ATPase [Geminicoccaceae bacterium]|nr:MAG: AFG1 family ATPase [Geminicoccaceae bacterium]
MVEARYRALLEKGEIDPDPDQARAVAELGRLQQDLAGYRPKPAKRSLFGRRKPIEGAPQGVYLHGGVGRGKSMLMDLFHGTVTVERKRRVHFHDFMLDVHARLHARRQTHPKEGEPLVPLADALAAEAWLLCFDEFHVTNITDAMILGRLFANLFERGVVVVATSNWAPDDLYSGGLQRQLFLPFIDLLKTRVNVLALEGQRDYRLDRLIGRQVYFSPLGPAADAALQAVFADLTDDDAGTPDEISVGGRKLVVPRQAKGVAWFHFDELCARALGAADYLSLATHYHTLILDQLPRLTPDKRNEARRFITLVDALYERGMHLVCAAEAPPERLYPEGDGAFEFQRTVSRLMEMQSQDYVERARERAAHPGPFEPFALTSDL